MIYIEAALAALICAWVTRKYMHIFQLLSTKLNEYLIWLRKHNEHMMPPVYIGVGVSLLYYLFFLIFRMFTYQYAADIARVLCLLLFVAGAWWLDRRLHAAKEKKPFVFTARMKRLAASTVLTCLAGCMLLAVMSLPPYLLFALLPYITLAAGYFVQPIETSIQNKYLRMARRKMASMPELIKIGITGSYGKTSVKTFLATILSEKYNVFYSPGSINTPMGLCKAINNELQSGHQVFLAEMGARYAGDIKELTDFVKPKYGVLTSVGPQHLETFGSLEAITQTKYDLIASLPEDGASFFAADGGIVDGLYEKTQGEKYRAGMGDGLLDMRAQNVQSGPWGSRFELVDMTGNKCECETRLLGRFNVANIALAACVARKLGLTMEEIGRGVSKLQAVEHRLQLIDSGNGVTVIDDGYNANSAGAKAALETLSQFPGRHVIVTPGIVEGGEKQYELNYRLGTQIAQYCDMAILVGPRQTEPVAQGAKDSGLETVYVVSNLDEATAILGREGRVGDTVLFESDLPDQYNEK